MAGATAAGLLAASVLIALAPADRVADVASIGLGEGVAFGVAWLAFSVVGAIIVRHQPDNLVGWMCGIAGLQVVVFAVASGVATYALAMDQHSSVGVAAAWAAHTGSQTSLVVPLLILLRFPTGRPLGPWWRRAEGIALLSVGCWVLVIAFEPMPLLSFPTTPNPLGLGQASRLSALGSAFVALAIAFLIVVVASLVVRFRRGSPRERRQLRWLAVTSVLVVGALASASLTSPDLATTGRISTLTSIVNALAFAAIPVSIGIAIVHDRLYDIDRIVNRTLVYAAVSAVLGGVYAAAVLGLSAPLGALSPAAGNTLATAASTLIVATLFRPVRARAQAAVDRRFDRERYQATKLIESFSGQIRDEIELDGIVGDLRAAATLTVHPDHNLLDPPPAASTSIARGD